jgi:hypothetical protein
MRNTCFWTTLVLLNAAEGRAKKRKEGRKEKSFGILSSTDNSPIDVL